MSEVIAELDRIAAEYKRRAREVPEDYYALSRPGNLLMHSHTVRACVGMLRRASLFPPRGRRILDIGCGLLVAPGDDAVGGRPFGFVRHRPQR